MNIKKIMFVQRVKIQMARSSEVFFVSIKRSATPTGHWDGNNIITIATVRERQKSRAFCVLEHKWRFSHARPPPISIIFDDFPAHRSRFCQIFIKNRGFRTVSRVFFLLVENHLFSNRTFFADVTNIGVLFLFSNRSHVNNFFIKHYLSITIIVYL